MWRKFGLVNHRLLTLYVALFLSTLYRQKILEILELIFRNGPIQWRGSASMGFSKSRVEDEWFGEPHTSTSDSLDWHSWKIEKVASGGWKLASGGWVLNL